MITKAILLVGGKGTRLMPLTTTTPKPMLRIAGSPVTEHQIIKAREAGIREIVLATSYLAEVFEPYFGDGSDFGIRIKYSIELEPLGTGGAIAHAAQQLNLAPDESFFVFNGDVISAHDLTEQNEIHQRTGAQATLHLVEVEDARAYGCVPLDDDGRVQQFLEKMENPIAKTINAGCYILTSNVVAAIKPGEVVSVERETFPKLLESGARVTGFVDSQYWIDMGTPQSLIQASRDLILVPGRSSLRTGATNGSLISTGAKVDPTARIGEGSCIEDGAVIGAGAIINGSIISAGAKIDAGVVIIDSFIAPDTRVISGSSLNNVIFGY